MKVKLKNNSLNAAQVLPETTEDFMRLTQHFPFRPVGSRQSVGGYWVKGMNGETITAFWGQWFIWCDLGVLTVVTDELFKELFEITDRTQGVEK